MECIIHPFGESGLDRLKLYVRGDFVTGEINPSLSVRRDDCRHSPNRMILAETEAIELAYSTFLKYDLLGSGLNRGRYKSDPCRPDTLEPPFT